MAQISNSRGRGAGEALGEFFMHKHSHGLRAAILSSTALIGLLAIPGAALAQDATAAAVQPQVAETKAAGEEIIVLGTRRTDRTVANSASPIDIISSAELTSQPTGNIIDSLKNIIPSFFSSTNSIADASTIVRAPSLRGLPSDQVLVQLNGKRFNRSALVQVYAGGDTGLSFGSQGSDMSSIPSIGIKSLQVLRDGATAQYGSDAIAGVLNYGLRDDAGIELEGRYGQNFDQHDGKSYQISGDAGVRGDWGFINLAGEYNDDGQSSRGATRPTAVAFAAENPTLASQLPNYPLPAQIWGSSPSDGYKFLLNAAANVTDNSKLYLFANYAKKHVDAGFNFRSSLLGTRPFTRTDGIVDQLGGRSFFQVPYYQTQCPAGSATCTAGGYVQDTNTFLLSSIYPGGFTPRFVGDSEQQFGTIGYKGGAGALKYDLSASLSKNTIKLGMYSSTSPSFGGSSQTSFQFGKQVQKEFDANLDMTYDVQAGLASPVTLSWGAEYRKETFTQTAGDPQSYAAGPYAAPHPLFTQTSPGVYAPTGTFTAAYGPGSSGYAGTSPTYAGTNSESSYGVYGGAEADLTPAWSVGVTGRYEKYKLSGGAFVYKLNSIYKLSDAISIRGTLGSGFHAPSPGQNNTQVLSTTFVAGQSLQIGTFPVTSAIAQFYGAVPLRPEKSKNYGAGLVLKPASGLTVTIDAYEIDVTNRIFISQNYTVTQADINALPELASVGVGGAVQYFTNSFDTSTKGIDFVGTYRTRLADGALNLTLAYNYNKSKVTRTDGTISDAQIIDIGGLAPNHRGTLSAAWNKGPFSINARENYYGKWVDAEDYPFKDNTGKVIAGQEFGSKLTTDLDISYTFARRFTLTLGALNIFNTYPDKIQASPDNPIYTLTNSLSDGQIYPRSGGPFGTNGGFWYAKVKIKY